MEVSMQDGIVNLMRYRLIRSLSISHTKRAPRRAAEAEGVPMIFPCYPGGSDDYVMIHIAGALWETVLAVIGRADLIGDERYFTEENRAGRGDEVLEIVSGWDEQAR